MRKGVRMDNRLGWRINELLLLSIILFQFLDFLKVLSPFWDYVKKIVSWAIIAYLLYTVSPSNLFFGEKRRWWDGAATFSYFLLTLKNIVDFAAVAQRAMLAHILDFVALIPTKVVSSVVAIPVNASQLVTFQATNGYLPEAASYAQLFAPKLTLSTSAIPLQLAAGNQTAGAILQPYGLDGLTMQLYNTIVAHSAAIERVSFLVGAALLLILGLWAALRFPVRKPSVLEVISEDGVPKGTGHATIRVLAVLFVMTAFFVLLFNLVVEWLAIAVDAPLAMTGLAAYALIAIRFHLRHHRGLDTGDLISRIGNFGNGFVRKFGKLFTAWRTVPLGLSGLLVLHLLVDVGALVLPSIIGLRDILYFGQLSGEHAPLYTLLAGQLTVFWTQNAALALLYLLNAAGIIFLLVLPAYIWYKAFRIATRSENEREEDYHPHLPGWFTSLGIASTVAYLVAPAYRIVSIRSANLVGVDLQTHAIATAQPGMTAVVLLGLFAILLIATRRERANKFLMATLFLAALLFFGVYILEYFLSSVAYHLQEGTHLIQEHGASSIILAGILLVFLAINLLFYVFGYFSFTYELWRDE